ncbi:hypothetical protein CHARACLAT_008570 [Characodon lateralis]|uniref:Uncharacterized protein n=1 Tax=Characodon lateralis TaxID=208331 RepID=A0ABU7DZH2_9TELE|nr:hypothetical protein [Characodon lateralis]
MTCANTSSLQNREEDLLENHHYIQNSQQHKQVPYNLPLLLLISLSPVGFKLVSSCYVVHVYIQSVSHFLYRFFHSGSRGSRCLSPAVYGREAGYTLDWLPVHRRATQTHTGQTTTHTLIHT